jgi:hypothetical protein
VYDEDGVGCGVGFGVGGGVGVGFGVDFGVGCGVGFGAAMSGAAVRGGGEVPGICDGIGLREGDIVGVARAATSTTTGSLLGAIDVT